MAVSGTVIVPKGRPPKGGWPIVSWGHGTTGIADRCAPSRNNSRAYALNPLFKRWIHRGFAIAATDYEGLGTPADAHPFANGRSAGRSVIDIVRAARQLDPRIGRRTIIAGGSLGGQAALWAASIAPKYMPGLNVRGTVAFAPATHFGEQLSAASSVTDPDPPLSALVMSVTRGADIARPKLKVPMRLSDVASDRYAKVDQGCALDWISLLNGVAPADIFERETDSELLTEVIGRLNDAENLRIRTPVRIHQGTADSIVLPTFSEQTADAYRSRGTNVTYRSYEGVTHSGILAAAGKAATAWMRQRAR